MILNLSRKDDDDMKHSTNQNVNGQEKYMIIQYLFYAFTIAWIAELILIFLYRLNIINGIFARLFHFGAIGLSAGMAPAYAAFIVERKHNRVTARAFCKKVFWTQNHKKSCFILVLFALIQFFACSVQESYLGYPWYYFILFMPMMILGGGLEELGWQGVFQPLLQKRFSFLTAAVIEGTIWSVWHLPLWFVPNTAQSDYDFAAFTLYCITLGITLAAAHRITKSIWVSVLLHAWGNVVLGGMYSLTSLCRFPGGKTVLVSGVQILAVVGVLRIFDRKKLQ